jgi:hypothetical protein
MSLRHYIISVRFRRADEFWDADGRASKRVKAVRPPAVPERWFNEVCHALLSFRMLFYSLRSIVEHEVPMVRKSRGDLMSFWGSTSCVKLVPPTLAEDW